MLLARALCGLGIVDEARRELEGVMLQHGGNEEGEEVRHDSRECKRGGGQRKGGGKMGK